MAAVHPAGPDPMMTTFSAMLLLPLRRQKTCIQMDYYTEFAKRMKKAYGGAAVGFFTGESPVRRWRPVIRASARSICGDAGAGDRAIRAGQGATRRERAPRGRDGCGGYCCFGSGFDSDSGSGSGFGSDSGFGFGSGSGIVGWSMWH